MRKRIFYFGMLLILIGLASLAVCASLRNIYKKEIKRASYSWIVFENLTKGKTYIVDIFSSDQWRNDYSSGYTSPDSVEVTLDVNMFSPDGGETKLQVFFFARASTSEYYTSPNPTILHVKYNSVDSDSLEVDENYGQIRFKALQDGTYTVKILENSLYWSIGPPEKIVIYEEITESVNPILVLTGGMLGFSGLVISIVGAQKTERILSKKRSKQKRYIVKVGELWSNVLCGKLTL